MGFKFDLSAFVKVIMVVDRMVGMNISSIKFDLHFRTASMMCGYPSKPTLLANSFCPTPMTDSTEPTESL